MHTLEYLKQLEDPYYLPSREEIISQSRNGLSAMLNTMDVSQIALGDEMVTKELIAGLTDYIVHSYNKVGLTILEVGAGDGKLAYHMSHSLASKYPHKIQYRGVDDGHKTWKNALSLVEHMNDRQGIQTYMPDIILCSWLSAHPPLLSPGFIKERNNLLGQDPTTFTNQQTIKSKKMHDTYEAVKRGPDITYYWRQNPSLQEYILIGPSKLTGDREKTHGYKKEIPAYCDYFDYITREQIESVLIQENPAFVQDGFEKKELQIPTINKMNLLLGNKDKSVNSQVFSFKRMK